MLGALFLIPLVGGESEIYFPEEASRHPEPKARGVRRPTRGNKSRTPQPTNGIRILFHTYFIAHFLMLTLDQMFQTRQVTCQMKGVDE